MGPAMTPARVGMAVNNSAVAPRIAMVVFMALERMILEMLPVGLIDAAAFRSRTICPIAVVKCSAGVKRL